MKRRTVLAGALAAPAVMGLATAGLATAGMGLGLAEPAPDAALPGLTLYDARLPRAERAAWQVHLRGGEARPTGGEIAALLLRERLFARGVPVLGITGHAEFLLAADIARTAGRKVAPLMQLGAKERWLGGAQDQPLQALLESVLGRPAVARATGTAFVWIAR